jgi:hypothetical protein
MNMRPHDFTAIADDTVTRFYLSLSRPYTQLEIQMKNITPAALSALARGDIDNFVTAATPGGIEAQEAAGQATLCASAILPKECPQKELESFGVKFGKDHDDIFVCVTLPPGWKKQATDHSMWSDLIDDKGRKRAAIFYKAAFYDRSAHMRLECRYNVDAYEQVDKDGNPTEQRGLFRTSAKDGETVLQSFGIRESNAYNARDAHATAAEAWLSAQFPEWRSVTAYWD